MSMFADTSLPYKAGQTFKYGEGIHLNEGNGIVSAVGAVSATTLTNPWTLDLWCKETVDNVVSALLFMITSPVDVNDRIVIGTHDVSTTKMALWNNAATARVISTWDAPLSSTSWRHFAFVFDGQQTSVYVNGVLVGTLAFSILAFTTRLAIRGRTAQTTARAIIERYRFRSGTAWTANFDPDTIYD